MMNFGPIKLLFTAVAALLILGPTRLPSALRSLTKAVGSVRRASSHVAEELRSGLDLDTEPAPQRPAAGPEDLRPGPRL
jgi:Sec-independent protein translocase protein TatA